MSPRTDGQPVSPLTPSGWLTGLLAGLLALAAAPASPAGEDALYDGFAQPAMTCRPMVRWWWVGNAVTKKELLRQLDVLRQAGIGGVEINPVSMPPGCRDIGARPLVWLSKPWNDMLKTAVDGARRRGMIADLIVGSGWPFGGRFLEPAERTKKLTCKVIPVQGPGPYRTTTAQLLAPPGRINRAYEGASPPRLLFVRLVPRNARRIDQCLDLTDQARAAGPDGQVILNIPPGRHNLYIGLVLQGFSKVVLGAPGADGPVLDHFNKAAVEKYLNRMSEALDPVFGGKMGNGLRAMFCDSIELSGANWTDDLPDQFRRRRGYDPAAYLPLVLTRPDLPDDSPLAHAVRRARYDYSRTLVELFHERFIDTFCRWCRRHGLLSRYQAYGTRMIGMLDGYLRPDIPEGDTWLFFPRQNVGPILDGIRYAVWNKYASSGAHLAGRKLVSCESMTNLAGVFAASLNHIKQADDLNFITGINQTVLHGFTYSPPQAGFPGWVRYGTYFSEQNTWWPHLHHWTDYNARLSWLFRSSQPVMRIAILGPDDDVWSDHGLDRPAFIDTPWYRHHLWQAFHQNGCGADYLSPAVLQNSRCRDGRLCYGPAAYDLLVVLEARSIEPATAQALLTFARAGGHIAFVGNVPGQSPGLDHAADNDKAVRQAMEALMEQAGRRVAVLEPPARQQVRPWAARLLQRFDLLPDVRFGRTDDRLFQIHRRHGRRDIFFLCNLWPDRALQVDAVFDTGDKTPWRWDPMTGRREVYPHRPDRPNALTLDLGPLESLVLVFEPDMPGTARPADRIDRVHGLTVPGPWQVTFHPVAGQPFRMALPRLVDFKDHPRLKSFAGTATYRTTFHADGNEAVVLSLGTVHGVSQVSLNGRPLGLRWWGRHEYDLSTALQRGDNQLAITVTTVLRNYVSTLTDEPVAMNWTGQGKRPPVSAGLVGPVQRLRRLAP